MTTRTLFKRVALSAAAFPAFCGLATAGVPFYRIDTIGLYDGIHQAPPLGAYNAFLGAESSLVIGVAAQFATDDGGETYYQSGVTLWAATLSDGVARPLGLHGDGVHGISLPIGVVEPGYVFGVAARDGESIDADPGTSAWVSNMLTGTTVQVGLYDSAHALPNELPDAIGPAFASMPFDVNGSGRVIGESLRNSTNDGRLVWESNLYMEGEFEGWSVWAADAATGVTTRHGLTDAAHTMPTLEDGGEVIAQGGFQSSMLTGGLTSTGYFTGVSLQFGDQVVDEDGPMVHVGESLWVGNADTGKSYQVGLTDASHSSERGTRAGDFAHVSAGGYDSAPIQVTADGITAGVSISYTPEGEEGLSAWMARYEEGSDAFVTTRIGFFGTDAGGAYRDADGLEFSWVERFTETGLIAGYSALVGGSAGADTYQSAWIVNAHGGSNAPLQVGLLDADHLYGDGYHATYIYDVTDSGIVAGQSSTFGLDGSELGTSAWVQKVAGGTDAETFTAERVGLYEAEHLFTEYAEGAPVRSHAENQIQHLSQTGLVYGAANRYADGETNGRDAWIAYRDGLHYTTDQVGLVGGEYENATTGERFSEVRGLLADGAATGYSDRHYTEMPDEGTSYAAVSKTAWVATRSPGESYQTVRVGLYDGNHTSASGYQETEFTLDTRSGYVAGYSKHFGIDDIAGETAWVADVRDGVTRQVGLADPRHTDVNGVGESEVTGLTETGFAWGYSIRYTDDGFMENGETAWVYSFSDNALTPFELSVSLLDGYAFSRIAGVRDDGLAYGSFDVFDQATGDYLGSQAFGWTSATGVFLFGDLVVGGSAMAGASSLATIEFMSEDGVIIGYLDDGRLFIGTPVPEPSTYAALAGAAVLGFCLVRRRRGAR